MKGKSNLSAYYLSAIEDLYYPQTGELEPREEYVVEATLRRESQSAIGSQLGVSASRVGQILRGAVRKLWDGPPASA